MKYKLTIDLLPKGAWGNDLSKTLSKKDWDTLREACYARSNHRCAICGASGIDLDAHEVWEFDIKTKTQTLKDIIALCSACHGVKHMRNSERIGYGDSAKAHFIKVNRCSDVAFAGHYAEAQMLFDQLNEIERWKIKADLTKFGGAGIEIKNRNIPKITNPYENIKNESEYIAKSIPTKYIGAPKIRSVDINNYQGEITIVCDNANRIEWSMDGEIVKTKYNVVGRFTTTFSVEDLEGSKLRFRLIGDGGQTYSEIFGLV